MTKNLFVKLIINCKRFSMSSLSDAEARFTAAKERLLSLIKSSVDRTEGGSSLDSYNTAASVDPSSSINNGGSLQGTSEEGLSSLQQLAQDFHSASGRDEKSRTLTNRRSGVGVGVGGGEAIPASEMRQLAAALPLLQPVNPHHHHHHSHHSSRVSTAPHTGGSLHQDRSTNDGNGAGSSDSESGGGGGSTLRRNNSGPMPSGNSKKKGKGKGSSTYSAMSGTAKPAPKDFDLRLGPAYQADIDKMREKSEHEWEKRRQEAHSRMQMLSLSKDGKSFHILPPNQINQYSASSSSSSSSSFSFHNTHHHGGSSARSSRSRGGSNSKNNDDASGSSTYASYSSTIASRQGAVGTSTLHLPSTPMGTSSGGTFAFPAALTGINVMSSNSNKYASADKASSSSASAVLFQQRQQFGVAFHPTSATSSSSSSFPSSSSSSSSSSSAGQEPLEKFTPSMTLNTPSFPPSLVMPHINLSIRNNNNKNSNNSTSYPPSAPHSPTNPSPTIAQQQQHLYQSQQALFEQQNNALQRLYYSGGGDSSRSSSPASNLTKSSHGDSPERLEELTRAVHAQQLMLQQLQHHSPVSLQEGQPLWSQPLPTFQFQQQPVLPSIQGNQQQQRLQETRDPRSVRMQIDSALAHSKPFLPPSTSQRTSPIKELSPSFSMSDSMLKQSTSSGSSTNYAASNPLKVGSFSVGSTPLATPISLTQANQMFSSRGFQSLPSPSSSASPPSMFGKNEFISSQREGSSFVPPSLSNSIVGGEVREAPLSPKPQVEVKYGLSVYDSHRAALSSSSISSPSTSALFTAMSSTQEDSKASDSILPTFLFSKDVVETNSQTGSNHAQESTSLVFTSDISSSTRSTEQEQFQSPSTMNYEQEQNQSSHLSNVIEERLIESTHITAIIENPPAVDSLDVKPSSDVEKRNEGVNNETADNDVTVNSADISTGNDLLFPLSPILPSAVKAQNYSATPLSQSDSETFNALQSATKNDERGVGGVDLNYSSFSPAGVSSTSMVGVAVGLDDYVEEMRKQLLRQQMLARGIILPAEVDDLDGDEDALSQDVDDEEEEGHGEESLDELRSDLLAAQAEIQMKTSPIVAT